MDSPETTPGAVHGITESTPPQPQPPTSGNPLWSVSLYRGAMDAEPALSRMGWVSLVRLFTDFRPFPEDRDKRKLPAWSPATLRPGTRRGNDNVDEVSCIVLDYDDGTPVDDAVAPWTEWAFIVHTSWSHTAELAKFRLVVPLARPVPAKAWRWVWSWAASRAAGKIDGACKDASRLYFLPARRGEGPTMSRVQEGAFCDPEWWAQSPESWAAAGRSTEALAARIRLVERPSTVSWGKGVHEARHRLKVDPEARRRAADLLGAATTSERAWGIPCPRCGRNSVWFLLEPDRMASAACNHRNSCGWFGWIDELSGSKP